jgi:hypothetical protein
MWELTAVAYFKKLYLKFLEALVKATLNIENHRDISLIEK